MLTNSSSTKTTLAPSTATTISASNKRKQSAPKSKPIKCCNKCSFSSNEIAEFIEHMKLEHNLEDVYSCELCHFYAESLWDFQVHMENHQLQTTVISDENDGLEEVNEKRRKRLDNASFDQLDNENNHNSDEENFHNSNDEEEEEEGDEEDEDDDDDEALNEKENLINFKQQRQGAIDLITKMTPCDMMNDDDEDVNKDDEHDDDNEEEEERDGDEVDDDQGLDNENDTFKLIKVKIIF